jgi:hypothetical protein
MQLRYWEVETYINWANMNNALTDVLQRGAIRANVKEPQLKLVDQLMQKASIHHNGTKGSWLALNP